MHAILGFQRLELTKSTGDMIMVAKQNKKVNDPNHVEVTMAAKR